jgi:hypothetical protein
MTPTRADTRPSPDDTRPTLETTLANLPTGCTILIHRTDQGEWYKLLLRDDMKFMSYDGAWVKLENMAGMIAYAIELQQPPQPADGET